MSDTAIAAAQLIDEAFGNGAPPAAAELVRSESTEAKQVRDFFEGKRWPSITLPALQDVYVGDGSACLWFMTPAAAAYYLPAYLKMAVLHYYEADAIATELMSKLRRVAEGEESNLAEGLAGLAPVQNEAVARALEVVASEYESGPVRDAGQALRLRWSRYLRRS